METRSSKRKRLLKAKSESEIAVDRISHLPDAVLHHILLHLPIKTIAQTSVLSKRWRILWSSFPDLDFTTLNPHCTSCFCFDSASAATTARSSTFTSSPNPNPLDCISQTLAHRQRGSDIRVLRFRARLGFSKLNGLIRSAIKHKVQELDIDVCTEDYFNLPRCIVMSDSLRALTLNFNPPGFRLPPSLMMKDGFHSLQKLSLSHMVFYKKQCLLDLFSGSSFPLLKKLSLDNCCGMKFLDISCRALEDLTVANCFQLHGLDISSPRLERLTVLSCFESGKDKSWVKIVAPRLRVLHWEHNAITEKSSFENLGSVEEAFVGFFSVDEDKNAAKYKSVSNVLAGLSHAHCLTLQSHCIQILSNNHYSILLHPFKNLKTLELHIELDKNNIRGLVCLFRSSPTLHTLILKIITHFKVERRKAWNKELWDMSSSEEQYWESQSQTFKSFLQHLKVVKMEDIVESENEIGLVKFLLKHGMALQEMILCSGCCNSKDSVRRHEIRSQMMGFSWASSNAKIAFQ